MTKAVRIENADNAKHAGVVVEVWERSPVTGVASLIATERLSFPTQMATLHIWSNRYLVIKEEDITGTVPQ